MSVETKYVGDGKVYLIAGGNEIFTDIAARFVRSERPVSEIIESPYNPQIVKNILESGHGAALEFDYFIFGVEGYSRVCEVQLVRKRMASYLIKSGRQELNGKRQYSVVIPENIKNADVEYIIQKEDTDVTIKLNPYTLNQMIEHWYDQCLKTGNYKEEDLRYMKPQATEFKAIIGMNCYDDKTEVLTTKGWKYFKDLSGKELFYSMNPETKKVEYVRAIQKIEQDYFGNMIHVKSRRLDLCTTPNHFNLAFLNSKLKYFNNDRKLSFVIAGDMDDYTNVKFTRSCKSVNGVFSLYVTFPEINNKQFHHNGKIYPKIKMPMNEFLKILGFYLSDGSIYEKNNISGGYNCDITFSKGNRFILEKYKKIIDKWFKIDSKIYYNNNGCYKLQFKQPQLGRLFKKLGTAREKYIPSGLFNLSQIHLKSLLEGLLDGDVSKRSKNKEVCSYCTSSKKLADDVQRLLLHCGLSGQIYIDNRIGIVNEGIGLEGKYYRIERKNIFYNVIFTIRNHDFETVKKYKYSNIYIEKNYNGKVYCVELEKYHTLYVRRNGKPVWSGNCHALRDWWMIRMCRCAQTEIRDLATKMFNCVKDVAPELVEGAGPSCKVLGYCPEGRLQHEKCKGKIYTKEEALSILKEHKENNKKIYCKISVTKGNS